MADPMNNQMAQRRHGGPERPKGDFFKMFQISREYGGGLPGKREGFPLSRESGGADLQVLGPVDEVESS